jgi:LPS export ABC transporter protein LptC
MIFRFLRVLLLWAVVLFTGCAGSMSDKPTPMTEKPDIFPAYSLEDVTHYQYESGVLRLRVDFDRGYYYDELKELRIENCTFVYYDRNEEEISSGHSRKATLYQNESLLVAEDEVVIFSKINRGTLETDYLEWRGNDSQFVTDRFVTITRYNGDTLQGIGMITDMALNYVTIERDVKGSFIPE